MELFAKIVNGYKVLTIFTKILAYIFDRVLKTSFRKWFKYKDVLLPLTM